MIKMEFNGKKIQVELGGTPQEILNQTAVGIAAIIDQISNDDKDFDACMEYLTQLINSIDYDKLKRVTEAHEL